MSVQVEGRRNPTHPEMRAAPVERRLRVVCRVESCIVYYRARVPGDSAASRFKKSELRDPLGALSAVECTHGDQ